MWLKLDGKQFGRLTVMGRAGSKNQQRVWLCRCRCGKRTRVVTALLNNGHVKSCGCLFAEIRRPNLVGETFGSLIVLKAMGIRNRHARWLCRCQCGKNLIVPTGALRHHIRSCGCLIRRGRPSLLGSGEAMMNRVISSYRNNAKLYGLRFALSRSTMMRLFASPCHYCAKAPSQVAQKPTAFGSFIYSGIDRKDNSKGYIPRNVLPCCRQCNTMKSAQSYEDFLAWVAAVARTLHL